MRTLIIPLCLAALVGCSRVTVQPPAAQPTVPSQPAQPVTPPAQPPMAEGPPETPKQQPVIPTAPSTSYLKGYRDGYYGTWLGPVRWVARDDYRAGWSAGSYDRHHNLPNRFDR